MSTTSITASHSTDREQARRALLPVAVGSTLVPMAFSFQGADGLRELFFDIPIQLVAAVLIFGVVVPRGLGHESAGGRGLAMAVIGLLLVVPAFWLGLPIQLGAAAVLLGYAGKRAVAGSRTAIASMVLGLIVVVAHLAIYVGDYIHVHG
jgi:hypothetical protein